MCGGQVHRNNAYSRFKGLNQAMIFCFSAGTRLASGCWTECGR